jgi:thioredoxin reductase
VKQQLTILSRIETRRSTHGFPAMKHMTEIAIIGAGPYGLSLAAHLREAGVPFRIFGKPMDSWRHHMPKDMLLKSDGFASSLSAPAENSTLKSWCAANKIPYADAGMPVRLDVFNAYADAFQRRFVPSLEQKHVVSLERGTSEGFRLILDDGKRVNARNIVLAPGITWFADMPKELSPLPAEYRSHSFQHRDVARFARRHVVVLGAGASAIDLAASLHDAGAKVKIVTRADAVRFHNPPHPNAHSLFNRLRKPPSGIGPGWRSFFCANFPGVFHGLPESTRLRITRKHLGPAPGWFMREKVMGNFPMLLGQELKGSRYREGLVELDIEDAGGNEQRLYCHHVIAATGFKPELVRLPFLSPFVRARIAQVQGTAILSPKFETSVPGLYVIGPAAANSFGPLMRFMVGAEYTSPLLAAHFRKTVGTLPAPVSQPARQLEVAA